MKITVEFDTEIESDAKVLKEFGKNVAEGFLDGESS